MKIKPALTAEEWAINGVWRKGLHVSVGGAGGSQMVITADDFVEGSDRHALAALCLDGQEFGFTKADVEALKYKGIGYDEGHDQNALDLIADKIEALLPHD